MNTKTVKERLQKILEDYGNYIYYDGDPECPGVDEEKTINKIDKLYRKELPKEVLNMSNEMPPTILDDDIANWEHDNLVDK